MQCIKNKIEELKVCLLEENIDILCFIDVEGKTYSVTPVNSLTPADEDLHEVEDFVCGNTNAETGAVSIISSSQNELSFNLSFPTEARPSTSSSSKREASPSPTISSFSCGGKKRKIFSPGDFNLRELLKKTLIGKAIINLYKEQDYLDSRCQSYLVEIITSHFFNEEYEKVGTIFFL
ncbi:unnamed protein product [Brassicogethes aeneus]|uniref:Uncharacterized protein n=1 Tax=Brassicogethes aeneus TaxID=1431903 RepID=A0A9P0BBB1_BRAAE|nr:unnamed protein product [Brassicogethes aeneus]